MTDHPAFSRSPVPPDGREIASKYLRMRAEALGDAYDEAREVREALEASMAANLALMELVACAAVTMKHQDEPHGCLVPCELAHEMLLVVRESMPELMLAGARPAGRA